MKILGKSFTLAAASAALAAGVITPVTSASAATPQPKGGWVAIKVDPSARSVTPATTKDVGGGTWTYGTSLGTGGKTCYSYYFHGSKTHYATAQIAGGEDFDAALAGQSAMASLTAGAAYTCYVYWSVA